MRGDDTNDRAVILPPHPNRAADRFVRRWVNQLLRYIPHMHRKDIDGLVGCLAAVENAVGIALPAMGPLRAAARQRGMQGI